MHTEVSSMNSLMIPLSLGGGPKENKKIEKGDFVIFDFEGLIDNEKMEKGSSKNYELEIASNQFIPGFACFFLDRHPSSKGS